MDEVDAEVCIGSYKELLFIDFKGRIGTMTGLIIGTEEEVQLAVDEGMSIGLESPFPDIELLDTDRKG